MSNYGHNGHIKICTGSHAHHNTPCIVWVVTGFSPGLPSFVVLTLALGSQVIWSSHDLIGWAALPETQSNTFTASRDSINTTNACGWNDSKIKGILINKGFTGCRCIWSKVPAWCSHSSVWSCSLTLRPKSANGFHLLPTESEERVWKIHSVFMMNIWKSPLTDAGRERKHASSNCVYWLGGGAGGGAGWLHDRQGFSPPSHYFITEEPGVRGLTSALSLQAFTADIPELSPRHPGDKPGVKLSQREPCTSRCCTCSSLWGSLFCTFAVFTPQGKRTPGAIEQQDTPLNINKTLCQANTMDYYSLDIIIHHLDMLCEPTGHVINRL